jgi:hypothetical protein
MGAAGARVVGAAALCVAALVTAGTAHAVPYAERSAGDRALLTGIAVVANLTPVVSAFYAPRCLPGYVVCKVSFAGISVVVAAGQLLLSGGSDLTQTRSILNSGFGGDWFLTGKHVSGDVKPDPYPEAAAPPPSGGGQGGFEPPPL